MTAEEWQARRSRIQAYVLILLELDRDDTTHQDLADDLLAVLAEVERLRALAEIDR
jgi:hypothetical protein